MSKVHILVGIDAVMIKNDTIINSASRSQKLKKIKKKT